KSLVASGTRVQGGVYFDEGLRVDGEVKGNVIANEGKPSVLVVGDNARVEGEVSADHVIINGEVVGPVTANTMLELQAKAKIEGDVYYRAIELHLGAMVAGQLRPMPKVEEKPALKLAS
ncbi:MAG: bactofilin family protein, partial [Burkholderiaceae bacterium]